MKRLYRNSSLPEVGLVKGLLDKAGIDCAIRNEQLSAAFGGIALIQPELWIVDDADFPRAHAILDAHLAANPGSRDWYCPKCHERNEGQFAVCWKCGAADEP